MSSKPSLIILTASTRALQRVSVATPNGFLVIAVMVIETKEDIEKLLHVLESCDVNIFFIFITYVHRDR